MVEKVKVWHDPTWTCLLADCGAAKATVSLTRLEAAALRQKLVPPEAAQSWDSHGDGGEGERLSFLSAGHVLTESEARDLTNLLDDWNDEIGNSANVYHDGRLAGIREVGGEELVAAVVALDEARRDELVNRAMAKFRRLCAERKTEAEGDSLDRIGDDVDGALERSGLAGTSKPAESA